MNTKQSEIDFYILSDSDLHNRLLFVCRLVENFFDQQLSILIITANNEQLHKLNNLIWSFKPERFIAHEIIGDNLVKPLPKILLSDNLNNLNKLEKLNFTAEILIDLSYDATPLDFPKVILVANQYQEILANARMKYQSYIDNGDKPKVHKLSFNSHA